MLAAGCGFAQTKRPPQKKAAAPSPPAAAPADKWPIQRLTVEGNHDYTAEQVLAVAGLKIGQMAGKPEFDAARDRLLGCGAFENVSYKFGPDSDGSKTYLATFQVVETPTAYPVRMEDLGVAAKEIEDFLHQQDPLFNTARLPATKPVLDHYVRLVEDFLASKEAPQKVKAEVMNDAPDQYFIVFRPAKALPAVARVTFEGNKVITQTVLQDAIWASAVGLPYTEKALRNLLDTGIRPLYEARGRIRVAFPSVTTEPVSDVEGIKVHVTVDEGEVYSLAKVALDGPVPLNPEALMKAGDFKSGDIANFDRVSEGVERIHVAMRKGGYLEAKVTTQRKLNDEKKTVDVAVHVDAGPLFTMGKVTYVGLDLEGEAEMNRMWNLKPGSPFNPEYPDFFLKRVRDDGVFDHLGVTKAETKIDDKGHTVDVTLRFAADDPKTKPGRRGGRGGRGGEEMQGLGVGAGEGYTSPSAFAAMHQIVKDR
ncbi:Surface antigen variable number repeat protein [Candidatus Sulfopaludibacter sp. SbA3]|nr:Surface antigen variable number repeat protein [Candidatus Sulfopaludibacter sp. SbA3]